MIAGFSKGDRVAHAELGLGRVVFVTKDNVGIVYDNGCRGAYCPDYFRLMRPCPITGQ